MASESLVGGSYDDLSPATQQLLDAVLGDTVGGLVTTTNIAGGILIVGTGAGGVQQGAVISQSGAAITGEIEAGALTLSIALPAGISLAFEGPSGPVSAQEANTYITNLIDAAFPASSTDPDVQAARASLVAGISALTEGLAGGTSPNSVTLRLVALTDSGAPAGARVVGSNEVVFDGHSTAGSTELLVFFTSQLGPNKTLVLNDVAAALILGNGTVQVDGYISSFVAGDSSNQTIIGGLGSDTLVGGGGNDTITGGLGQDVFGVDVLSGNLTITDFDVARDKLAFKIPGINQLADLAPLFTGLTVDAANSPTLHFGNNLSITLVGVSPEQLTVDLLQFGF